jgi:hypothetical protein
MVAEELKRLGWDEKERQRLRRETTLRLKWIAQRLPMGSWTYASNLLNEEPRHRCAKSGGAHGVTRPTAGRG